ncbi:amidohydrolase [Bradyrhizobium sp. LA6.4]
MMAARDDFWIRIEGIGGHGAHPHQAIDPVVTAAYVATALQSVVSRNLDPMQSAVITLHSVQAGTPIEIGTPTQSVTIPPVLDFAGVAKWFDPQTGDCLERRIREVATGCAAAFGAAAEVTYKRFLPATVNTSEQAVRVARVAMTVVGRDNVKPDIPPSMGSEDFSFMLQVKPGAYFRLGIGDVGGCFLHNPRYDFNDEAIVIGSALFIGIAEDELPMS